MNKFLLSNQGRGYWERLQIPYINLSYLFLAVVFWLSGTTRSSAQQWPIIGQEQAIASGTSAYTNIATVAEGAATFTYVVFTEAGVPKVKRFDGTDWTAVGGPLSTRTVTYTRIYANDNGVLYVTYVDAANGNRLAVKTFNTTTEEWEPLGRNATNLYVSTGSVTNTISQYSSTARSSLAFDAAGVPFIAFGEGTALNPMVKKFNGTSWETIGGAAVSAQRAIGINLAIDNNDIPYLVFCNQAATSSSTGNLMLYQFVDNIWQAVAVPVTMPGGSSTSGATSAIRHTAITFNSAWNLVITYFNASNSNRATAVIFNKSTSAWSLSGVISGRDISSNSLSRDEAGNVYAAFSDAISNGSGRSVGRVFKLPVGATVWLELINSADITGVDEPVGNFSIITDKNNTPYVVYTKSNSNSVATPLARMFKAGTPPSPPPPPTPDVVVTTPMKVEKLSRGLVAIRLDNNRVYLGWRLFGTELKNTAFNIYRDGQKINATPITESTNYIDETALTGKYTVRALIDGVEKPASAPVSPSAQNFINLPLQIPAGGVTPTGEAYTYVANDCSAGDLDGDGEYEIVVKWDPSNAKDNSQAGYTGNVFLDAYKLDGTRLWRIDLGRNIRAGAHYTQFMVYDFDGDGKAEMACKTADATKDGQGAVIGNAEADYRNTNGYILTGPEFLTVFNGQTGAAMDTKPYLPARGTVSSWGDNYGNRVDRFIAAVAYLDGANPSMIFGRGYYTRLVRAAWDFKNGVLVHRWTFDSNNPGNSAYAGQGNHQMTIGDADGDGKQEIFNGSSAVNDNGAGLWSNGMGHGDALHLSDMDPDRPGLEMWQPYEYPPGNGQVGAALIDAKTGNRIFTVSEATADVGRGMAADIDPRHKGYEVWASRGNLYNIKGEQIGTAKPSMNFGLWWDGDLMRELLDGNTISKWNYENSTRTTLLNPAGVSSNNSTKATPALSADLFGDWREEVVFRSADNTSLQIFTTTIPTPHRIYTLMHDPHYRAAIAWQNSGYNQPPHTGFYLGTDMAELPAPNIVYVKDVIAPVVKTKNITVKLENGLATILPQDVDNGSTDAYDLTFSLDRSSFDCSAIGENTIKLTVTDENGNVSVGTAVVTVEGSVPVVPIITVTREDKTLTGADANTIFLGYGAQQLTLIANASSTDANLLYTWTPAANLSAIEGNRVVFSLQEAGTYTITVISTNTFRCSATATVTLTVIDARCGNTGDMITMCHKGNEICIAPWAVPAHLEHGCSIGGCAPGSTVTLVPQEEQVAGLSEETVVIYPNPTTTKANVSFEVKTLAPYSVEVYNFQGVKIDTKDKGVAKVSGVHLVDLNVQNYPRGSYLVKITVGKEVYTRQLLIQ